MKKGPVIGPTVKAATEYKREIRKLVDPSIASTAKRVRAAEDAAAAMQAAAQGAESADIILQPGLVDEQVAKHAAQQAALHERKFARSMGVPAKITTPARTVVDCFRFRSRVGLEAALEALDEVLQDDKATFDEIWRAAVACRARYLIEPLLNDRAR